MGEGKSRNGLRAEEPLGDEDARKKGVGIRKCRGYMPGIYAGSMGSTGVRERLTAQATEILLWRKAKRSFDVVSFQRVAYDPKGYVSTGKGRKETFVLDRRPWANWGHCVFTSCLTFPYVLNLQ